MLLSAFILGLAGSLHCVAMCGPLVLAVPPVGRSASALFASRASYHLGRILTYGGLGLLFGAIGRSLVLVGFQRWLSLFAGIIMLGLAISGVRGMRGSSVPFGVRLKRIFSRFLHRRSYPSLFALGAVNGLLPCGLVYVAGTASAAYGEIQWSILYMITFGLGTVPALLAVGFGRKPLSALFRRFRLQFAGTMVATLLALTLILRGLALGIPYVSPAAPAASIECPSCAARR